MVALSVSVWFWWVGLLVGGFVGYMTYDLKVVAKAVCQAWREIICWRMPKISKKRILEFGEDLAVLGLTILIMELVCTIIFGFILLPPLFSANPVLKSFAVIIYCSTMFLSAMFGIQAYADSSRRYGKSHRYYNNYLGKRYAWHSTLMEENVDILKFGLKFWPKIIFWIRMAIFWVGKFLFYILPKFLIKISPLVFRFFKRIFILIHSDRRLLRLVGATIGVYVGYLKWSVLLGAVFGGLLGVLAYEIISKRILRLHLAPNGV